MDRLIASNSVPMAQADTAPVSGTPQGATDGNPASNVPATRWPSYQYNAIQEELIAILTAANVAPDRTNNAQIAAAIRALIAQSAAVIGDRRNLAMSVTAASASATLSADEIVVGSALGGQKYVLASFSKTINLATTGAGGMDTGSAPASGFVALYAIYNPTTGAQNLLATNATSAVAPSVYGGANMPNGYTASALASVWQTNSSGQLIAAIQYDRSITFLPQNALTTTTAQSSYTSLSIASNVPKNAKTVSGGINGSNLNNTGTQLNIAANSAGLGAQIIAGVQTTTSSGAVIQGVYNKVPLITPQTIYYTVSTSTGTATYVISVNGYDF